MALLASDLAAARIEADLAVDLAGGGPYFPTLDEPHGWLPTHAFSVCRRLFAAYVGPLFELRRLSDNQLTPIYALPSGFVDEAAIQSWCGSSGGRVRTIYNQAPDAGGVHMGPSGNASQGTVWTGSAFERMGNQVALAGGQYSCAAGPLYATAYQEPPPQYLSAAVLVASTAQNTTGVVTGSSIWDMQGFSERWRLQFDGPNGFRVFCPSSKFATFTAASSVATDPFYTLWAHGYNAPLSQVALYQNGVQLVRNGLVGGDYQPIETSYNFVWGGTQVKLSTMAFYGPIWAPFAVIEPVLAASIA